MSILPGRRRSARSARLALLTASAVHLGIQAGFTSTVYPTLFGHPSAIRDVRSAAGLQPRVYGQTTSERQRAIGRLAGPLAGTIYPLLGAGAVWAGATLRRGDDAWVATSVAALTALAAPAVTLGVTGPMHVAVSGDPTRARVHTLIAVDRVQTGLAAIGVIAALRAARPD